MTGGSVYSWCMCCRLVLIYTGHSESMWTHHQTTCASKSGIKTVVTDFFKRWHIFKLYRKLKVPGSIRSIMFSVCSVNGSCALSLRNNSENKTDNDSQTPETWQRDTAAHCFHHIYQRSQAENTRIQRVRKLSTYYVSFLLKSADLLMKLPNKQVTVICWFS